MNEPKRREIKGEERAKLLAKYTRLNRYLGLRLVRNLPVPDELMKKCDEMYKALFEDGVARGMTC